jgi:gas vesicle protein
MTTNTKVLLGVLLGATIGTVTALLMAPASGLRTRKSLNKKAKKMVKQFEGLIGKGNVKRKLTSSVNKNGRASVAAR